MNPPGAAAIWHDVECGAYAADLPVWAELADAAGGPVLELGCGTGRVALHLARRGHQVVGLDRDAELLAALRERGSGLAVEALHADAREFAVEPAVALAIAPTHLVQLLGDEERVGCLHSIAASLRPGGRFAASILEEMPAPDDSPPPLPDVREVDGWVYSSLAVEAAVAPDAVVIHRLRQTVSPDGELDEEPNEIRIATFPAAQFEAEAEAAGLRPRRRVEIPPTDIHVGSLVVIVEKEA